MAQSVKRPTSAQVMILQLVSLSPVPALCWRLRAWSLLWILCLPLCLPLPHSFSVSLCLSKINKNIKKFYIKKELLLFPCHSWGIWDTKRWSHLIKASQPVLSGKTGIWSQGVWVSKLCSYSLWIVPAFTLQWWSKTHRYEITYKQIVFVKIRDQLLDRKKRRTLQVIL